MDTASVLNAAADLLEKPGAWTQGQSARRADGADVFPDAPDAVCWCIIGALVKVGAYATVGACQYLPGGWSGVPDWNDDPARTQSEVVATLRAAAVKAGGAK